MTSISGTILKKDGNNYEPYLYEQCAPSRSTQLFELRSSQHPSCNLETNYLAHLTIRANVELDVVKELGKNFQ